MYAKQHTVHLSCPYMLLKPAPFHLISYFTYCQEVFEMQNIYKKSKERVYMQTFSVCVSPT